MLRVLREAQSDETKVSHIHTKVDGWIEKTYIDFVGSFVKRIAAPMIGGIFTSFLMELLVYPADTGLCLEGCPFGKNIFARAPK